MKITEHFAAVLADEAKRQKRTLREVGTKAGNKNVLYKLRDGKDVSLTTLWSIADSLGVPASELAYRVERRVAS